VPRFLVDTVSYIRLFPRNVFRSFLNHRGTLQWRLLTSKYAYSRLIGFESAYQRDELFDEYFAVPSGALSDQWQIQLRLCLVPWRQGPALRFKGSQRQDSLHVCL
jgi:hypothetical protein